MIVSIRPAPHSKRCALDGRSSCNLYQNHQEKCAMHCKEDMCCEMKHCWAVGRALETELTRRGHSVFMADPAFRKRWPESAAAQATREAMAALNAHNPHVHLAIHTNANSNENVRGIQAMYPPARYGERAEKSRALSACLAAALQDIYDGKVSTREYSALETNTCPGAGCYLELGYGNTNRADAQFVHEHPREIACALADGLEAYALQQGLMPPAAPEKSLEERVAALEAWRESLQP